MFIIIIFNKDCKKPWFSGLYKHYETRLQIPNRSEEPLNLEQKNIVNGYPSSLQVDAPRDEDAELRRLEREQEAAMRAIGRSMSDSIPIGKTTKEIGAGGIGAGGACDDDDDEDEDDDDNDDSVESHEVENSKMLGLCGILVQEG